MEARVAVDPLSLEDIRSISDNPPPFLFFTGKGGVGKTSLACASAINLAAEGKTDATREY